MNLALQLGHGMMALSEDLVSTWGGGAVVLSPRDLEHDQMLRLASRIHGLAGGAMLLDPQFYLPHADCARRRIVITGIGAS